MTTVSLTTLRASVRQLGDYEASTVFTDAFLDEWINRGIEEYHEFLLDSWEGYYDKVTDALVTVAGVQEVDLPTDFLRLRLAQRKLATDSYTELRRVTLVDASRYGGRGAPRGYALHGASGGGLPGRIRLWPVPDGVYTLRLTYAPVAQQLVVGADTIDLLPGGDRFVVYAALFELDEREGRPVADRQTQIDRAKARIKASAKQRNTGEPEYLMPRSSGRWDEDD